MKNLVIVGKTFYYLLIGAVILLGVVFALSRFNITGIPKSFAVQSGSMAPAIPVGSVIIINGADNYQKGDIITFGNDKKINYKQTTTHRIAAVVKDGRHIFYKTKGDANKNGDLRSITSSQILGKVIFMIPYLGFFVAWATSLKGFITLIIIPATIIIYIELVNIKQELTKVVFKRKKSVLDLLVEEDSYREINL